MASKKRRKTSNTEPQTKDAIKLQKQQDPSNNNNDCCFEGDRLSHLLHSLKREVESELQSNRILPEKVWFKQHFSVGINEVTRLLERMAPSCDDALATALGEGSFRSVTNQGQGCPPGSFVTKLQAVLLASDCNSRWLTKHLPSLASSRNVPLIYVKDNKEGSLRLGEVVKVRTTIALGVKVKGSSINCLLEEVLQCDKSNGSEFLDSTKLATISCQ